MICYFSGNLKTTLVGAWYGKEKAAFIPQEGSEFTADWFTDLFQEQYGAAVLDVCEKQLELVSVSWVKYIGVL